MFLKLHLKRHPVERKNQLHHKKTKTLEGKQQTANSQDWQNKTSFRILPFCDGEVRRLFETALQNGVAPI